MYTKSQPTYQCVWSMNLEEAQGYWRIVEGARIVSSKVENCNPHRGTEPATVQVAW